MKLSELTAGLEKIFVAQHMGARSLLAYRTQWKELGSFLSLTYGDDQFDIERGLSYFRYKFGLQASEIPKELSKRQLHVLRVVNALEDYKVCGSVRLRYSRNKPPVIDREFSSFLTEYVAAVEAEGLSRSTVKYNRWICRNFLLHLGQLGIGSLSQVDFDICESFMKTWASYSPHTIRGNIRALRHLLRYLHARQVIDCDIASKLHGKRVAWDSLIPSGWSADEINKLLDSIDRNSPIGKRDYAMILLAYVLALRCGDIVGLKFGNFNWRGKKLSLVQHKSGRPLELPLPKEVREALLDYIKNGRPKYFENKAVFIRHETPFSPFEDGKPLTAMLDRRRRKAGIPKGNMHRGFHSLRHAAASAYLEMETPLTVITEILGHSDARTTNIYLKRDLKKLAECVLEPEERDNEKD